MGKSFVRNQLPAIFYMVLIFVMSSIPHVTLPDVGVRWEDKIVHLVEYLALSFLLGRAFYFQKWHPLSIEQAARLALWVAVFYAATDELHQYFVPGRFADVWDWVADSVGAYLGMLVIRIRLQLAHEASS